MVSASVPLDSEISAFVSRSLADCTYRGGSCVLSDRRLSLKFTVFIQLFVASAVCEDFCILGLSKDICLNARFTEFVNFTRMEYDKYDFVRVHADFDRRDYKDACASYLLAKL